jgi:hypothetical protein
MPLGLLPLHDFFLDRKTKERQPWTALEEQESLCRDVWVHQEHSLLFNRRPTMKIAKRIAVAGTLILALMTTACGTVTGAAVGAGAGAAIGAGTGYGAGKGALIGTGVGAAAGAIYDITK